MVTTKKVTQAKVPSGPVITQTARAIRKPTEKSKAAVERSQRPVKGKAVPEKNQSASTSRTLKTKPTSKTPLKAAGSKKPAAVKTAASTPKAVGKNSPPQKTVNVKSDSKPKKTAQPKTASKIKVEISQTTPVNNTKSPAKASPKTKTKSPSAPIKKQSTVEKKTSKKAPPSAAEIPLVKAIASKKKVGSKNANTIPNIPNPVVITTEKSESEDKTMLNQTSNTTAPKKSTPVKNADVTPTKSKFKIKSSDLEKLKNMLLEERERILDEMRILDERSLQLSDNEADQQPGFSLQLADSATENIQVETDLAIRSIEAEQLRQIDDALRAIEDGDYGRCQRCHLNIDYQRLKVKPNARFCISCLRLLEAGKA